MTGSVSCQLVHDTRLPSRFSRLEQGRKTIQVCFKLYLFTCYDDCHSSLSPVHGLPADVNREEISQKFSGVELLHHQQQQPLTMKMLGIRKKVQQRYR